MKPAIKRACLLGTALFSLCASAAQAAGVLVGTWDLRGNGQLAAVYRDGANLQVVEGGSTRNYSFGNVVWSVFGATDTDGQPGAEILVKAGPDLVIVSHASTTQRKYPVGNVSWAIMRATDVDNVAGDEVILSIGNGVRTVFDRTRTQRDATFSYNGTWGLFDVADVDGAPGKELVLNMGNGVKVIDPRTGGAKDFTFSGYHALAQIADLDGQPGAEIIGRTSTGIYVISNASSRKEYNIGASAWALYGGTADTDGKPGNEPDRGDAGQGAGHPPRQRRQQRLPHRRRQLQHRFGGRHGWPAGRGNPRARRQRQAVRDQRPHRQGKQLSRAGCVERVRHRRDPASQRAGGPSARA